MRRDVSAISVLILTQDNCAFCEDAKGLFQELSGEFPLSISTLDINSPQGEKLALRGQIPFPPGIFINGEPFCYGRPSARRIRHELTNIMVRRAHLP